MMERVGKTAREWDRDMEERGERGRGERGQDGEEGGRWREREGEREG